jgi:hypothetical protein
MSVYRLGPLGRRNALNAVKMNFNDERLHILTKSEKFL